MECLFGLPNSTHPERELEHWSRLIYLCLFQILAFVYDDERNDYFPGYQFHSIQYPSSIFCFQGDPVKLSKLCTIIQVVMYKHHTFYTNYQKLISCYINPF